jgi:hypothetical protein
MTLEEWLGPARPKIMTAGAVVSARTPTAGPLTQPAILHSARRDAVLAQDARTAALFASGGRPAGLPAYRETPLAGCTTVLDFARRDTGFDPTQVALQLDVERLSCSRIDGYFNRLSNCPLFTDRAGWWPPGEPVGERRNIGEAYSLEQLLQMPDTMLADVMPETREVPLARLRQLGGSFNDNITINPFYYSAIKEQDDVIDADIVIAGVWLHPGRSLITGMPVPMASWAVRRLQLRFNTQAWTDAAAPVSERHYQTVSDWLASN